MSSISPGLLVFRMHQTSCPFTHSGTATSLQDPTPSQLPPGLGSPESPSVVGAERSGNLPDPQGCSAPAVMENQVASPLHSLPTCPLTWEGVGEEEEWEEAEESSQITHSTPDPHGSTDPSM